MLNWTISTYKLKMLERGIGRKRRLLTLSSGASTNPFRRILFKAVVFALGASGKSPLGLSLFVIHVSLVKGSKPIASLPLLFCASFVFFFTPPVTEEEGEEL
jgi:hypothetical protein